MTRSFTVLAVLFLAGVLFLLVRGCGNAEEAAKADPVAKQEPEPDSRPGPEPRPEPIPEPEPWFVDEARERGIVHLNRTGRPEKKEFIMSAVGPGAAVFDANGDGRMDVYIPDGNWLMGGKRDRFYEGADRPRNALYIQQADGSFSDEAEERGVDCDRWGFGACAADLDNDGDQDLIVANLNFNRLYVNDGTGHFRDVAPQAGTTGSKVDWSTGIAVADYDKDGLLDIYIANYADMFEWMRTDSRIQRDTEGNIPEMGAVVCQWQNLPVYCGPVGLPGQQDYLFRNRGGRDGKLEFEDVTRTSGVFQPRNADGTGGPLYGFQPLFTDLNRDGWLDIYIANDSVPSFFLESQKDGTFVEKAQEYGIAVGNMGDDMAGMGADSADINGDGLLDVHKTNFAAQTNNVYVAERLSTGVIRFRDRSESAGVQQPVFNDMGWGTLVFDFDHDGDRDLCYANGHVYPEVDNPRAAALKMSFRQLNQMFQNVTPPGRLRPRFERVTQRMGPGFAILKSSRGASLVDVDNDGDLDILVVNLNDTPDLLVNKRGNKSGHWLMLKLVGDVAGKTNLEAIGSRVKVTAGGRAQHFETKRGQSFLGCNDPRIHVGLGAHKGPVEVEITWPHGEVFEVTIEKVDREVEIRQKRG